MKHDIFFEEQTHTYIVDGMEVPSVTTILNYMSDVEYSKVNPSVLEQAARRGSLVHEYTELMDYDAMPDEVEYEVAGYLEAYAKFLRDYKPDWDGVEKMTYSEEFYYIGTIDRIGKIDGRKCIVDIKTLASPTKMNKFTVCSQTAAYGVAEWQDLESGDRYALYLNKDGEYNLMDCREYEKKYGFDSFENFFACKVLYDRIQNLKNIKPIRKGKK